MFATPYSAGPPATATKPAERPGLPGLSLTRPKGFEPLTFGSVDRRSIQLSYGREFCSVSLHDLHRGSAGWRAQDKDNGIKLGATAAGRLRQPVACTHKQPGYVWTDPSETRSAARDS